MGSLAVQFVESPFVEESFRSFSNVETAIGKLRQIGRPPPSLQELSPDSLDIALQIFCSLLSKKMFLRIRRAADNGKLAGHWASLLGPWIAFILQEVIQSGDGEGLVVISGLVERSNWTVPIFLTCLHNAYMFRPQPRTAEIESYYNRVPNLKALVARRWFGAVKQNHPSVWAWSSLLYKIVVISADQLATIKCIIDGIPASPDEADFVLIQRIHHEAQGIPTADSLDFPDLKSFLFISRLIFQDDSRLESKVIKATMVPAMAGFTFRLLHRRKSLREISVTDPECERAHSLAVDGLFHTAHAARDRYQPIHQIIDAGFIPALFKAMPCFFERDARSRYPDKIPEMLCQILERVSKFLIYPTILRLFLRQTKRAVSGGDLERLEREMRNKSEELWDCWKHAHAKALFLREVRGDLKSAGILLACSYKKVFIRYWTAKNMQKILDAINEMRSSLMSTSARATSDEMAFIRDESKTPIVVLDFERVEDIAS
ncbi:hypothetical protein V5O48_018286, partial [Marasmius crinis-equi]